MPTTEPGSELGEHVPALEARGLYKRYRRGSWLDGNSSEVDALVDVDLRVRPGEIVAVAGPSGSGKSTLARCLALLEAPDRGELKIGGQPVPLEDRRERRRELRRARRRVQLVLQDPARAISRRFTVLQTLAEPMLLDPDSRATAAGRGPRDRKLDLRRRAVELLRDTGLDEDLLDRPSHSASGGQLQRLALARALATDPRVLLLDETFSGLDLSSRAHLVDLLLGILEHRQLACVLISHDRNLVTHLADRALFLRRGRVEQTVERADLHAAEPWFDRQS